MELSLSSNENFINHLYQSISSPDSFNQLLNALVEELNLLSGLIVMTRKDGSDARIIWLNGLCGVDASVFINKQLQADPLFAALGEAGEGELIVMGASHAKQYASEQPDFFIQLSHQLNIYYAVGVILAADEHWQSTLFFHRNRLRGEFTLAEVQRLNMLVPHLQHAIQRQHLSTEAAPETQQVQTAKLFDQVRQPVVITDDLGYVLSTNKAADKLFESEKGIGIFNQRLQFDNNLFGQRYDKARRYALAQGQVQHVKLAGYDKRSLCLMPLVNQSYCKSESGIAVFICSRQFPSVELPLLKDRFDLSDDEAKICKALMAGYDAAEIAKHIQVPITEVNQAINEAHRKSNTTRQADLISKILDSPATGLVAWQITN